MIRVLIVDDSKVVQEFLTHILSSDPEIKVVGIAGSGEEAIRQVWEKRPDVITMDIHMPRMNGLETTLHIMETIATPIVIVSGSTRTKDRAQTFKYLEAGALAVVSRPPDIPHPGFAASRNELLQTVRSMSEIRVVRRFVQTRKERKFESVDVPRPDKLSTSVKLIAIGASTGGPMALNTILSRLPKDLKIPVLIVQHITSGFVKALMEWLSVSSVLPLKIAENGEFLKEGNGYIAPDNVHMGVNRSMQIILRSDPPENGLRPSVDHLFRSVARHFGPESAGILLTGMGKDGAAELKKMKETGAITMAQDEESSVVYGMPGEAVKLEAADYILPPEGIAEMITDYLMHFSIR